VIETSESKPESLEEEAKQFAQDDPDISPNQPAMRPIISEK
jgi:hypothetical protein